MIPKWAIILMLGATVTLLGFEHGWRAGASFGASVGLFYSLLTIPKSQGIGLYSRIIFSMLIAALLLWQNGLELFVLIIVSASFLSVVAWLVGRSAGGGVK